MRTNNFLWSAKSEGRTLTISHHQTQEENKVSLKWFNSLLNYVERPPSQWPYNYYVIKLDNPNALPLLKPYYKIPWNHHYHLPVILLVTLSHHNHTQKTIALSKIHPQYTYKYIKLIKKSINSVGSRYALKRTDWYIKIYSLY